MENKPQIKINWQFFGGRKFSSAVIVFVTTMITQIGEPTIDIKVLALAILGFVTFIIVEGIKDATAAKQIYVGSMPPPQYEQPPKVTMSGKLKNTLENMEKLLRLVAPIEQANEILGEEEKKEDTYTG